MICFGPFRSSRGVRAASSAEYGSALLRGFLCLALVATCWHSKADAATSALPKFELQLAQEVASNPELARYYGDRGYQPIWVDQTDSSRKRLVALLDVLKAAPSHGLPFGAVQADELSSIFLSATDQLAKARAEARTSEIYLEVAGALASGVLEPSGVDKSIARKRPVKAVDFLLDGIAGPSPAEFVASLAPSTGNYAGLRKKLMELDAVIASGGWGAPVNAAEIGPDESGPAVAQLRNRLIRMGYLERSSSDSYTDRLMFAVKRFQSDHGLDPDGVADRITISAINLQPEDKRRLVLAALERSRWLNFPLGEQHVLVNLPDFHASVIRNGKSVFDTRVVVGKTNSDLQTPEFTDEMTHMVVNPTWWVPRSISTGEVLPKLKEDPLAEPQLVIFEPETKRVIDRNEVDFSTFSARNFPFEMRQPPGPDNALGRVKFMFPNRFNVYMHDTPWRALFQQERRSYSHGCIRVHRAFDLAEFLIDMNFEDGQVSFELLKEIGEEIQVNLKHRLPVHVTYQTAWVAPDGRTNFRSDIYGRDALIYEGLVKAGLDSQLLSN